jgi:GTP cyclohydrolase II
LPIIQNKQKYNVDWYASVRHDELIQTENLANTLLKSDNQNSFADLVSSMAVNSILIIGDYSVWEDPLIRIHSSCVTGDVFGSQRCECGPQLERALELIKNNPGGGMLIYMSGHEGRGIGLWAKAATYLLQDQGENTYQANRSLGLSEDSRNFSDAATLIKYFLGNKPFRLLTNNPKKINDLKSSGLDNIAVIKHVVGVTDTNLNYLSAKRDWGHYFEKNDLGEE